jgi:hypothetical protein
MQPSSGGCFPSIPFFSTETAAFVMPILFSDYCENMWYPCAFVVFLICFLMSCVILCGLCSCQPPEDGCMKLKHVVEEEEEYK